MEARERITRIINHQPVDRVGVFESFWWETVHEWHEQGLPVDADIEEFLDLDAGMYWFDQSFMLPRAVIEEDEDSRIVVDEWGTRQIEFKNRQTTPGHIGVSVESQAQWEDEYKPRLIYDSARINWEELSQRYQLLHKRGKYTMLSVLDPFECTWHKVGPEQQLMLMVIDPDWLRDMFDADTRLLEAAFEEICEKGLVPDALWIFGDIAYTSGMLFSPQMYKELLFPFHKRLCDLAHAHGSQVIYHSDGDVTTAIPLLLEAGIDCLHPLEVKAGMDILEVKKQYGEQLALMGNIDARLFQENDVARLEKEIRNKVDFAMQGSGYIFHSDHSIPPGTLLNTYHSARDLIGQIGNY